MLVLNKLKLWPSLTLLAIVSGCEYYQGADDIDIDPSYGPTQITQCNILTGISYKDLTSSLADFASLKGMKLFDEIEYGKYQIDLQIDDPYVIIQSRFSQNSPPQHILTFHETGGNVTAEALRREFYAWASPLGSWEVCPEGVYFYHFPKRTGWRLSDKHLKPKTE